MILLVLCGAILPWTDSAAAPRERLTYVERVLGAEADARLPLVVALHGLGSSPEAYLSLFDGFDQPLRVIAVRAPDPYQVGTSWFPLDAPKQTGPALLRRANALAALMAELTKRRSTRGRPIATGFSQGGMLTFALAAYHPHRIAAAIPLAGMLHPSMPAYRKAPAGFQVRALHGRDDRRIAHTAAELTVARLREVGTDATLEGFAGVAHEVPPPVLRRFHALLREQLARLPE